MNFDNQALIVGVHLRDLQQEPHPQTIFAEIVLLDRSHASLNPLLYELKGSREEGTSIFDHYGMTSSRDDAFAMVGEVLTIDKTKKEIYLHNDITVKYQYLAMISGLGQAGASAATNDELFEALTTIIEALRVRQNFSTVFDQSQQEPIPETPYTPHQYKPDARQAFECLEKILTRHFSDMEGKPLDLILSGNDKWLYELQL